MSINDSVQQHAIIEFSSDVDVRMQQSVRVPNLSSKR